MENKKIYVIKNGVTTLMSDDPRVRLEETYVQRVGVLKFTPPEEMEVFEDKLTKSEHAPKRRLAMLRREAGLLMNEIAEMMQISKNGYYKIEAGYSFPKLSLALKLAKLFDVSVEELFMVDESYYI